MKRSSLIGHVAELHGVALESKRPADNLVRDYLRVRHYLGAKDRRFITDTFYGMLRHHRFLLECARQAAGRVTEGRRPNPWHALVLYAAYGVKLLRQSADELYADLGGLWEAYVRSGDCRAFILELGRSDPVACLTGDPARRIAVKHSFPDLIVEQWIRRHGEQETEEICAAFNQPAPTVARVNTLQCSVEECLHAVATEGVSCRRTLLSPVGFVLERRLNIQGLNSYRRGLFEMQDEGSQLMALLLEPASGMCVVDACAGGGGKTLHLAALMRNEGSLIAIDVSEKRLNNIRQRVERAGVEIARVYCAGREDAAITGWKGLADAVLVDAPCTGVGTFRRNPGAKLTFTKEFLVAVSQTQRDVLLNSANFVKPGGRMVYSTCSLLQEENEDAVERFLAERPDFVLESATEILQQNGIQIGEDSSFVHLYPHRHGTDGFFAAVMCRKGVY